MFFSARQLDDLHKSNGSNGHLTLPYRARLTPLASEWVKARKIVLGYSDEGANSAGPNTSPSVAKQQSGDLPIQASPPAGTILWWCDGPCGSAKAAIVAQAKESPLREAPLSADPKQLVAAVKMFAAEMKSGRAVAGIMVVQNAALATVYANRCPSLRAVVGTCIEAVDQGVRLIAANVLIVEHPHKTSQQVKNLVSRFVRGGRVLTPELQRQLQELASCG